MKLYIKQKVFSLNEKFTVKNGLGDDVFFVEGQFLSIPKQFYIYDSSNNQVASIKKKLLTFMPHMLISTAGRTLEIVKDFTLLSQHYTIPTIGWDIRGDFTSHEYSISHGNEMIASISKEWLSWGDSYVADIQNDYDALLVLCVMICIDYVNAQSQSAAYSPA